MFHIFCTLIMQQLVQFDAFDIDPLVNLFCKNHTLTCVIKNCWLGSHYFDGYTMV